MSGALLKLIACAAMVLDHLSKVIALPQPLPAICEWGIGRIAFPVFAFLLCEGFCKTHSRLRYLRNLLLLAVISEIPFDLALHGSLPEFSHQNTCFTLALGLLLFLCIEKAGEQIVSPASKLLCTAALTAFFAAAAYFLGLDYGALGIISLAGFYFFSGRCAALSAAGLHTSGKPVISGIAGCVGLNLTLAYPGAFLALLPIGFYNGTRGKQIKYLFYLFYPAHLLVLWLLAKYLL